MAEIASTQVPRSALGLAGDKTGAKAQWLVFAFAAGR
jgi:hypothetical protein